MKKLMTIESPEDWPGTRTIREIYEVYSFLTGACVDGDIDGPSPIERGRQKEYWVLTKSIGGGEVEWKYNFKTFTAARSWAAWE